MITNTSSAHPTLPLPPFPSSPEPLAQPEDSLTKCQTLILPLQIIRDLRDITIRPQIPHHLPILLLVTNVEPQRPQPGKEPPVPTIPLEVSRPERRIGLIRGHPLDDAGVHLPGDETGHEDAARGGPELEFLSRVGGWAGGDVVDGDAVGGDVLEVVAVEEEVVAYAGVDLRGGFESLGPEAAVYRVVGSHCKGSFLREREIERVSFEILYEKNLGRDVGSVGEIEGSKSDGVKQFILVNPLDLVLNKYVIYGENFFP